MFRFEKAAGVCSKLTLTPAFNCLLIFSSASIEAKQDVPDNEQCDN